MNSLTDMRATLVYDQINYPVGKDYELQILTNISISQMNSVQTALRRLILIIDDEQDTTLSLQIALQLEGFDVDAFYDPHKALLNFRPLYTII